MSYIGAQPVTSNFNLDPFVATAGQTAFTLSRAPASVNSIIVGIDGVIQQPTLAYTLSGTTLTLTSALLGGEAVWVVHLGVAVMIPTPGDGTVTTAKIANNAVTTALLAATLISGLTDDTTPDGEADYVMTHDGSAAGLKKTLLKNSTKMKVGQFTINKATASGNVAYTGLGFKPKAVVFIAGRSDAWNGQGSIGADDGTTAGCLARESAGTMLNLTIASIALYDDVVPNTAYAGKINSLDADGFTIAWTRTGATGGTLSCTYIAFR